MYTRTEQSIFRSIRERMGNAGSGILYFLMELLIISFLFLLCSHPSTRLIFIFVLPPFSQLLWRLFAFLPPSPINPRPRLRPSNTSIKHHLHTYPSKVSQNQASTSSFLPITTTSNLSPRPRIPSSHSSPALHAAEYNLCVDFCINTL